MAEAGNLKPETRQILKSNPILAVMVSNDPAAAVRTGQALVRGGIAAVEFALRTPRALECAQALVTELPDLHLIAGTVLTRSQIDDLMRIGVSSAVAPGMNRAVVTHALDSGMSFAPGICTPSDMEAAIECGCKTLKYFPAEPSGGVPMLKSMSGPYNHLGLEFIPLGGIREDHIGAYLKVDTVIAIGGSWICPSSLIDTCEWSGIEERAQAAVAAAAQVRGGE